MEAAAPALPSAPQRAAWIIAGATLLLALFLHLTPALWAGMLLFSLVHRLDLQLRRRRLASGRRSRILALGLLGTLALILGAALLLVLVLLWRARAVVLPDLLGQIGQTLDQAKGWLGPQWLPAELREVEGTRERFLEAMKSHGAQLRTAGGHLGRAFLHILVGLVLGALVAFHKSARGEARPLADALARQVQRLLEAFENVVFAQVRISAVNTAFSAAYLFVVLPLFHVHLPMRLTLVVITFLAGLVPILGNLFSNTLVVLLSLGVGPGLAVASLAYLVLVHKFEYVLNAHIVGTRIHAAAWEVLVAMLFMEAAFGVGGLIAAPILYAFVKGELRAQGWV